MTQEEFQLYKQLRNDGCFSNGIALGAILIAIVLLFTSCKTHTVVEYRDRLVDNYIAKVQHDTLIIDTYDSVFQSIITRNDTVYDTKYIEKFKWRERIVEKIDTCWKDTVLTEYKKVTKEVVKIPKIYKYALIISIISIIFAAIKIYKWLRR